MLPLKKCDKALLHNDLQEKAPFPPGGRVGGRVCKRKNHLFHQGQRAYHDPRNDTSSNLRLSAFRIPLPGWIGHEKLSNLDQQPELHFVGNRCVSPGDAAALEESAALTWAKEPLFTKLNTATTIHIPTVTAHPSRAHQHYHSWHHDLLVPPSNIAPSLLNISQRR